MTETRSFTSTAIAFEGGLLVAALGAGWIVGSPPFASFAWSVEGFAYGLAGAAPLVVGLIVITRYPVGPFKKLDEISSEFIVPLFADSAAWQLLVISALAGIGEEALFRGVAQAGLERWWGLPWLALLVASVLFGLAHLITPTYAIVAALIGAYLGWLWMATGNLLVPIVTHGGYDFVALLYLLSRGRTGTESDVFGPMAEDDFGVV